MTTPPYVLLLVRTFLTLEGIAARVDPSFNIYKIAMPWAVRRTLSPSTREGITTLRSTILTEDNRIQWNRILELAEGMTGEDDREEPVEEKNNQKSATAALNDAIGSLLGSSKGVTLRRALSDLDSIDLVEKLLSKEARALRQKAVSSICEVLAQRATLIRANKSFLESQEETRPVSKVCKAMRERECKWKGRVTSLLLVQHLKRQILRGPVALAKFFFLTIRIALGVFQQSIIRIFKQKCGTSNLTLRMQR